ncbi:MAG TPA: copper homeostasis protein CutC [Planctomycetaceae bacterium]|nr:copper homeostasis protein CutC [Planctomycetaceae bacterium]
MVLLQSWHRMNCLVETCVDTIEAAAAAEVAGAKRIELNAALSEDGLTPSLGVCRAVRSAVSVPIIAMLRPHNCGFQYSSADKQAMLMDAEAMLDHVDGFAVGATLGDSAIDCEFLRNIAEVVKGHRHELELVMHRAFDQLSDQASGMESLIDIGFDRILTSGGEPTADAGKQQLAELIRQAAGRIEILPGCGVRAFNALGILEATGADQLHGSFRVKQRPFVDQEQIQFLADLKIPSRPNLKAKF